MTLNSFSKTLILLVSMIVYSHSTVAHSTVASEEFLGQTEYQQPEKPVQFDASKEVTVLKDEDVLKLEYASTPALHPNQGYLVYVKHQMDAKINRKKRTIWQINIDGTSNKLLVNGAGNSYSPVFSPDGMKLAYLSDISGTNEIFIMDMITQKTKKVIGASGQISHLTWSPNSKSIAFNQFVGEKLSASSSFGLPLSGKLAKPAIEIEKEMYRTDANGFIGEGAMQLFVANIEDDTFKQLTLSAYDHVSSISWMPDNNTLYFSANRSGKRELKPPNTNVYTANITTGDLTQITTRFGHENDPQVSPDGKWLAYTGFEQEYKGYHVENITLMSIVDGHKKVLTATLDRSARDIQWAENSEEIFFRFNDYGNTKLARVNLAGDVEEIANNLGGSSFSRPYASGDFDVNGLGQIAFTSGDTTSFSNISVFANGKVTQVTHLNKSLFNDVALGKVEEFTFKASTDATPIQGWLVKPPNFDKNKQYPLILEIHGGPFSHYGNRIALEAQLMAAKGYLVAYVNPRGSTGYGQAFADLIHHKFPSSDAQDLIDAAELLRHRDYVDSANLFVSGASAGGTLASWLIGKTDIFSAAAAVKPIVNWTSQVMYSDIGEYIAKHWFGETPWQAPEEYWRRSPISLVPQVKTPTLLLTGEVDYRNPIAETEQYYQALKMQGVEAKMIRIPNAGHDITSRPSNITKKVNYIIDWFEKYRK